MRVGIVVRGVVQGVGFRPFVHRAALSHGLSGWVKNARGSVRLEVQGDVPCVEAFKRALERDAPRAARIASLEVEPLEEMAESGFEILHSDAEQRPAPTLPPDLATCEDCVREISTPSERRHRYPFTNCTNCGPRYSIARALPYDRDNTSMQRFPLCPACDREYRALEDRRYHAQPIACPACGPALTLLAPDGTERARAAQALLEAQLELRAGKILALRGVGGFQLLCDATSDDAVARLRLRKRRPDKPFAVMFPELSTLERCAAPSEKERELMLSPEAPIVLLTRRASAPLSPEVSKESPYVGALLPYTPLHRVLLGDFAGPVVCTSGNRSSEPICTSTDQALARLGEIADAVLTHDREIVRPLDDSVAYVSRGRSVLLRRARGYAPLSVGRIDPRRTVLGLGAHLKSTVTLGHQGVLSPSQHLGDLESYEARTLLEQTVSDLCRFFEAEPRRLACDLHPDYASTRLAEELSERWQVPLLRVQHHHAHVAACVAEHELEGPVLGFAWDGTGLGTDGTICGSEALVCEGATCSRFARLASFPLPGGDSAARDPKRAALGALFAHAPELVERHLSEYFGPSLKLALAALERGVGAPECSSMGRLFDAVAALLGVGQSSFEGQAAMAVEHLARSAGAADPYPLELPELLRGLCSDLRAGTARERVARRFHETLIAYGCAVAERAGIEQVVLSGGCFQNRLLAEGLCERLEQLGFRVYSPCRVPANDGGISLGQAYLAALEE